MNIKLSGIDGTRNILSSTAKLRVDAKMISHSVLKEVDGGYILEFEINGNSVEWKGKNLVLCSARNPYEPRIFKSIDGACSEAKRIGVKGIRLDFFEGFE